MGSREESSSFGTGKSNNDWLWYAAAHYWIWWSFVSRTTGQFLRSWPASGYNNCSLFWRYPLERASITSGSSIQDGGSSRKWLSNSRIWDSFSDRWTGSHVSEWFWNYCGLFCQKAAGRNIWRKSEANSSCWCNAQIHGCICKRSAFPENKVG